jgi:hypothetical protein
MLPEDNVPSSIEIRTLGNVEPAPQTTAPNAIDESGSQGVAEGELRTPAENEKKSIDVVFDLSDLEQANKLEWQRAAFGDGHAEVEDLGGGKVVLKLYPGGARRLL